MANISIQRLTVSELEAVDEVIVAAYGLAQGRKSTLQRYLALQPDGLFVAQQAGGVVGFGAAIRYDTFAYIGLMAVHPAAQKQGIGRLVLEHILAWLDTSGCATVLLDATPVGAALYEHLGFVEDDRTAVLQYSTDQIEYVSEKVAGERSRSGMHNSVTVLGGDELPALFAYDAHSFGSERATVLASYWVDDPQRVLVTHNGEERITGYLIVQSSVLGPWVADTCEDAERLLAGALTYPFKDGPGVFVSARHEDAVELFKRYGFSQQRTLKHMRRGKEVKRGRSSTIYGQASLGLG
jgi:ribosomal protein S18 acetylase RimI-like enzyme